MRRAISTLIMLVLANSAFAANTITCPDCTTLRDYGTFGAASLYRGVGGAGPEIGNDRIWVRSQTSSRRAFVDVDRPFNIISLWGFDIPTPDFTRTEVNATWSDGSDSKIFILPNEIIAAIAETLNKEEQEHGGQLPGPAEFSNLPGFNNILWRVVNGTNFVNNAWVFVSVSRVFPTPIVRIIECAWHSGC